MDRETAVNFICQRCSMPVRLGDSILNMNEHTLAELSLPIYPSVECGAGIAASTSGKNSAAPANPAAASCGGGGGVFDRTVCLTDAAWCADAAPHEHAVQPSISGSDNVTPSTSFTVLSAAAAATASVGGGPAPLSHQIKMSERVFDMLSTSTGVDHPMCTECADLVVEGLEHELSSVKQQAALYRDFVLRLKTEAGSSPASAASGTDPLGTNDEIDAQLEQLAAEERSLLDELNQLKLDENEMQQQLKAEEQLHSQLQDQEEQYWRQYCSYRRQLIVADDDYRSICNQLQFTNNHLERLKKMNAFNATFQIWHSGHFGTINNFRLGRLPSVPVEWWEINAAWGQTALLLTALARKIGLVFARYTVVPFGNHSVVKSNADGRELPLYGDGGFRFIWNPKFDAAMVAFFDCLQQLQERIETGDGEFRLPYRFCKGAIEDIQAATSYSVKIQLNSEEHWTKALKYMLTNLKWAIAWVCADHCSVRDTPGPSLAAS